MPIIKVAFRSEQVEMVKNHLPEVQKILSEGRSSPITIESISTILRVFLRNIISLVDSKRAAAENSGKLGEIEIDYDALDELKKTAEQITMSSFIEPKTNGWTVLGFGITNEMLNELKRAYAFEHWLIVTQKQKLPQYLETLDSWLQTLLKDAFASIWVQVKRDNLDKNEAQSKEMDST